MLTRRSLFALVAVTALAACSTPTVRTEGDTRALNIRSIAIDPSALEKAVRGRALDITKEQLERDLKQALTTRLAPESNPDGIPSDVKIKLEAVRLVSPGQALIAGGNSFISGTVRVNDLRNGAAIVPETKITGTSERVRLGGVIGALTSRNVKEDYRGTLAGFASTVKKALFGADPK